MDNLKTDDLSQIQALFGAMPQADFPVALLPVRLETRFTTQRGRISCWSASFRIEFIDTHEPN